jgi:hypothetical protein
MNCRTLSCTLVLLLVPVLGAPAHAQDCAMGKPAVISGAVPRALGKGPVWMTAETVPIKWVDAGTPVQLVWLMDAEARGPAIVSGKHRESGAQVRFTKLGDRVGKRELRWRLDPLGYQPTHAKPQDFKKFSFDRNFGWFPAPGCYEITGQFGKQESKIIVQVAAAK